VLSEALSSNRLFRLSGVLSQHIRYIKHGRRKKKVAQEKIKSDVLKQMYFNGKDENAATFEYFNLRSNAV
jgi:hypothetical protein